MFGRVIARLLPLLLLPVVGGGAVRRRNQQNDEYVNYPTLEVCDDLIIQVSEISTLCSTPQTFYVSFCISCGRRDLFAAIWRRR